MSLSGIGSHKHRNDGCHLVWLDIADSTHYPSASLTKDSNWHTLDISSYVPLDSKAVLIWVYIKDANALTCYFRKSSTSPLQFGHNVIVANQYINNQYIVGLNNACFDYWFSVGMDDCGIKLLGYWRLVKI